MGVLVGPQVHVPRGHAGAEKIAAGDEVVEVELPDHFFVAKTNLRIGIRRPGEDRARLGVEERARKVGLAGFANGGKLEPRPGFHQPAVGEFPGFLSEDLAASFEHARIGHRQWLVYAIHNKGAGAIEEIVGRFAACLEGQRRVGTVAQRFARDGFARVAGGREALVIVRREQRVDVAQTTEPLQQQRLHLDAARLSVPVQPQFAVAVAAHVLDRGAAIVRRAVEECRVERAVLQREIGFELTAEEGRGDRAGQPASRAHAVVMGGLARHLSGACIRHAMRAGPNRIVEIAVPGDRPLIGAVAGMPGVLQAGVRHGVTVIDEDVVFHVGHDVCRVSLLPDHICNHCLALHVDAWHAAADQIDPLHIGSRDAQEDGLEVVRLGRRALAVDQHVARRAGEAARRIHVLKDKPRQAGQHVVSGIGMRFCEKGGGIIEYIGLLGSGAGGPKREDGERRNLPP